jgi:hypothetical protein
VHALSLAKMSGEYCRLSRRKRYCWPDEAGLQEAARGPFGTVRRNRGAEISAGIARPRSASTSGAFYFAGLLAFIPAQRQPRIPRLFEALTQVKTRCLGACLVTDRHSCTSLWSYRSGVAGQG